MNFRFFIDPKTGLPHIYRHQVSEEEVEQIFLLPGVEAIGRDGARLRVGRTEGGRFLRVVFVPDPEPNSYFIITAYSLTGRQLRESIIQWQRRN